MTLKALAAGLELVLPSDRGIFPLCTTFLFELLRKLTTGTKLTLCTPEMLTPPSPHPSGSSVLVERKIDKDHDLVLREKAKHQLGTPPKKHQLLKFSPSP